MTQSKTKKSKPKPKARISKAKKSKIIRITALIVTILLVIFMVCFGISYNSIPHGGSREDSNGCGAFCENGAGAILWFILPPLFLIGFIVIIVVIVKIVSYITRSMAKKNKK